MWVHQLKKPFGVLRDLVVEPFANAPGQKGKTLEQSLNVGIAVGYAIYVEETRLRGMSLGKLFARLMQVPQFFFVILSAHRGFKIKGAGS
jgi:hypothetical protein